MVQCIWAHGPSVNPLLSEEDQHGLVWIRLLFLSRRKIGVAVVGSADVLCYFRCCCEGFVLAIALTVIMHYHAITSNHCVVSVVHIAGRVG